jgi:hypothetical protein
MTADRIRPAVQRFHMPDLHTALSEPYSKGSLFVAINPKLPVMFLFYIL